LDPVHEGVEIIDQQFPGGSFKNPHEKTEQSGLSRAIWAKQSANLSSGHGK
jgi:hypothetical protein